MVIYLHRNISKYRCLNVYTGKTRVLHMYIRVLLLKLQKGEKLMSANFIRLLFKHLMFNFGGCYDKIKYKLYEFNSG